MGGADLRKLTVLLYLNPKWERGMGGCFRVHGVSGGDTEGGTGSDTEGAPERGPCNTKGGPVHGDGTVGGPVGVDTGGSTVGEDTGGSKNLEGENTGGSAVHGADTKGGPGSRPDGGTEWSFLEVEPGLNTAGGAGDAEGVLGEGAPGSNTAGGAGGDTGGGFLEVEPRGGRLLAFWSDALVHSVGESQARLSMNRRTLYYYSTNGFSSARLPLASLFIC